MTTELDSEKRKKIIAGINNLSEALREVRRPSINQLVPTPPAFIVLRPLEFTTGPNNEFALQVPIGFITDLASIPKLLWWWQSPHESTMAPAIIHDFLYWLQPCTKDEADAVMYIAMLQVGMKKSQIDKVYWGIRTNKAQKAWDENNQARINGEKRFFSEEYTYNISDLPIDPNATIQDIKGEAAIKDSTYKPSFPLDNIRRTCQEALSELQNFLK